MSFEFYYKRGFQGMLNYKCRWKMMKKQASDEFKQILTQSKLFSTVQVAHRGSLTGDSWLTDCANFAVVLGAHA